MQQLLSRYDAVAAFMVAWLLADPSRACNPPLSATSGSSSFSIIDEAALSQLPTYLKMELPFLITHRGALHQEVVDMLVPFAATGVVPFQVFADVMKESRVEHAATAAVQYCAYVAAAAANAAPDLTPPQAAQQQPASSSAAAQQMRPGCTQATLTKFFPPVPATGALTAV